MAPGAPRPIKTLVSGFCMGVADLVPGISGGTIALILGIYEKLIHSIRDVRSSWPFLLVLLSGITLAMLSLSHLFHLLLGHPLYREFLFATFMGLICASVLFCMKKVDHWTPTLGAIAIAAAIFAFFLSGIEPLPSQQGTLSVVNPWIFFSGMVAICAMLLPGISGSTVLLMLGVYPHFVAAIRHFSMGMFRLDIDMGAFFFLANLGVGALLGAALFSRLIAWLLDHHHSATLAALIGLMAGALRAVWPFWSYRYALSSVETTGSPHLQLIAPTFPTLSPPFFGSLTFFLFGFILVFALENLFKKQLN